MRAHRELVFALLIALSSSASAQPYFGAAQGAVSGTGTTEIKRPAEKMRVHVDLLARGKNLKEALDRMKERQKTALAELQKLGSIKDSVKIEDPQIQNTANDPNAQMRMMMMMRRGGRPAKPGDKPAATPITVTAALTAEWKLESKDYTELLIASQDLKEKIEKADISGANEVSKLTPEEQEALEEMQAEQMYSSGNERKPGTPTILFVAAISEAERDKALADSFKKAQAQATRLAKAAGLQLGPLASLASTASQQSASDYYRDGNYAYDTQAYQLLQSYMQDASDDPAEAVGIQPGNVSFHVSVSAGFAIKP